MIFLFKTNNDKSVQDLADKLQKLNDKHPGKEVTFKIEITLNRAIRSNDQNARYWAILKQICLETGYTKDELHDMYKKKFNSKWIADEEIGQSTSGLDTAQFTSYMNQVEHHGREFFKCQFRKPEDKDYLVWAETVNRDYSNMWLSV